MIVDSSVAELGRAGLVSIPTSEPPRRRCLNAEVGTLRHALGAFTPDPHASRVARLRMHVGVAARLHDGHSVGVYVAMVTLTYRGGPDAWSPRHVSQFLTAARKWLGRRGHAFRYVWVAELQRRGVLHYHVALWLPEGVKLPKPDECGWWVHGYTRIERARSAPRYLLKYLSKGGSYGSLPKGARIYGVGGLEAAGRGVRRWLNAPSFVRGNTCAHAMARQARWRRVQGGGWSDPDGVVYRSEFSRQWVGSGYALRRVIRHHRAFEASGPYSSLPAVAGDGSGGWPGPGLCKGLEVRT